MEKVVTEMDQPDIQHLTWQGRAYGTPTAMIPKKTPLSAYETRKTIKQLDRPDVRSRMILNSPPAPQPVEQVRHNMVTVGQPRTAGISPTEVHTRGADETWYPGMLISKGITAAIIIAVVAVIAWAGVTLYTNYAATKTLSEGGITTVETPLE